MTVKPDLSISKDTYDAAIFDLDGVITRTARVHSAAWKELFDDYLARRKQTSGEEVAPFEEAVDYPRYVDGKPRYQGIKSFLDSRGIEIPWGSDDDSSDRETICGLGNRKNEIFHRLLHERGIEVYQAAAHLVENLKGSGFKVAVVSSSKNCKAVLDSVGLGDLFAVRVDGLSLDKLNLKGKPDPDMFLEAARRLGADPDRTLVFEDALSGVQAGRAGGFGCVVGVDRKGHADDLKEAGADVVIEDFHGVVVTDSPTGEAIVAAGSLPSALDRMEEIARRIKGRQLGVFLDYDATLTEIVENPSDAVLSQEMRHTLSELSNLCTVAVVSGRGLSDIRQMVDLENIFYAGSHGFEIWGPGGVSHEQAVEHLDFLDQAEQELDHAVQVIEGARIERKKFSIAVHFRQTPDEYVDQLEDLVNETVKRDSKLRMTTGKKIFEVQPDLDWHKGKAIEWLIGPLGLDPDKAIPLYIGDDTTDEDAFATLRGWGIGIVVDSGQQTLAMYKLDDPPAVRRFLDSLIGVLRGRN